MRIVHRMIIGGQCELGTVFSGGRDSCHETHPFKGERMGPRKIRSHAVVQNPGNSEKNVRAHLKASRCASTIWARRSPSRMRHETMYQLRSTIRAVPQLRLRTWSARNRREG